MLKDLEIPPQTLIVTIERNGKVIIPNGTTTIENNDIVILTAPSFKDTKNMEMSEIDISPEHDWINTYIKDLSLPSNTLIVMIKRHGNTIVPNGNTIVQLGDTLVLETIENLTV
jgi:cell volume regulation protein A